MLLLIFASDGVLVSENEVDLIGGSALVGAEHDDVRRGVGELVGFESCVILEELHVSTTALEAAWCSVRIGNAS